MIPSSESVSPTPLVLVHGLFDTPRLFDTLRHRLAGRRSPLLVPHLPHALGSVPLETSPPCSAVRSRRPSVPTSRWT